MRIKNLVLGLCLLGALLIAAPAHALWTIGSGGAVTFTGDGTNIGITFDGSSIYTVPGGDPLAGSYQSFGGVTTTFSLGSQTAPGVYGLTGVNQNLALSRSGVGYLGMSFTPSAIDFNSGSILFQPGSQYYYDNPIGSGALSQFQGGGAALTMTFSALAVTNSGILSSWSGSAVTAYGTTLTATPEPETNLLWTLGASLIGLVLWRKKSTPSLSLPMGLAA